METIRKSVFLPIAPLFLIAALTGCASSPQDDAQAVAAATANSAGFTPQTWAEQVDPEQVNEALQVGWLESFADPQLLGLVDAALANNRDLMAAAASVQRANALAVQAGARAKPQVNLAFANSRAGSPSQLIPEVNSRSLSAQLQWELDIWGRISQGQRAAVASAEAAAADYKYAQHSLAAALAKAYFMAIEAGQQISILEDVLASLQQTEGIVNLQYENGLASAQDLALTRSDLATTQEQLISLQASKREALRALEVLLGEYPTGDILVQPTLPALPKMPPLGLPSDILERRPDIIASERRVAAAYNQLNQAKAARLPQLSLTGSLGGASESLARLSDPANVAWQLAANLLVPIVDGGVRRAQVDLASAEQQAALAAYAQTALQAFSEVEGNLDLASTLDKRKSALEIALQEAQKAYAIADARHKEGEIALVDLLSVQQRVLSSKSALSTLQRLALEQRIKLYLALGGEW